MSAHTPVGADSGAGADSGDVGSGPGIVALTALHAKYTLIETARIPIAIIGSLVFPALALLFFVVPNRSIADDPMFATQAVIALSVFAVMSNGLFGFGLNIAEARERPWDPYLRTLPAPGLARVLAQIFSTGALGLAAILPVVAIGAIFTAAEASPGRLVVGLIALALAAVPFMLIGICVGYALPMKAAIAVVQILMFALAFGGGLFLPPVLFAPWLNALSMWLPTRQARELVIWAVQGGELPWWSWAGLLAWTIVMLALALALFRRDEGRRYR